MTSLLGQPPRKVSASILLCVLWLAGATLLHGQSRQHASPAETEKPLELPDYQNVRFAEDWSVLRGSTIPTSQRLKFIPLGRDGGVYVSLGVQARGALSTGLTSDWEVPVHETTALDCFGFVFTETWFWDLTSVFLSKGKALCPRIETFPVAGALWTWTPQISKTFSSI